MNKDTAVNLVLEKMNHV